MNTNSNILISGAGIAGLTLAAQLHQFGFNPSIVEKRPDLHDKGYMIDFYGSGFDVAEKMGLLDKLRARHYPVPQLDFVNKEGKIQGTFELEKFRGLLNFRHFNFMRGDLADILYESVQDTVPVRFGTSITAIQPHSDKVTVTFSNDTTEEFDLVIGADGFHSQVRELLWGSEDQFTHFLGYYVSCGIIEDFLSDQDTFYSYVEPKKQASIYPIRGNKLATFFAFKSDQHNPVARQQQRSILDATYGSMGWIIPHVLSEMEQSPHLYCDAVSQIKLASWHKGRVALVGDACQCLTLLAGQGASMAMAGAYLLADKLHENPNDYEAAFSAYQAQMKPEIEKRQEQAQKLAGSFIPDNRLSIWLTYLYLRAAFLPGFRHIFLRQIGAMSIIK